MSAAEWAAHVNTSYDEGDWSGVALRSSGRPTLALPLRTPSGRARRRSCAAFAAVLDVLECPLQPDRLLALGPPDRAANAGKQRRVHLVVDSSSTVAERRLEQAALERS